MTVSCRKDPERRVAMDGNYYNGFPQQNNDNSKQDQNSMQHPEQQRQYNFIDNSYGPYGYYPYGPAQQPKQKKKKPRKKWFLKFVRFTAAALIFGILAGAAASGYDYLTRPDEQAPVVAPEIAEKEEQDPVAVVPTKETKEPTVVEAAADAKGIVSDVSDIVDKVMPAIVAINSTTTITNYDFFTGRKFYEPYKGSGSGIIIGQNEKSLLILTNNHVIESADNVEIVFADESTATATVKGADARSDIAVLEVKLKELTDDTLKDIRVASLGDSDQVRAGDMVIAIGNALGYGQSVTVGYVSAVNRKVNIDGVSMNLIQTDAAINPGNSGGALINSVGEVIGMNSVKYASYEVEGMGYAIPITDAVPIIEQLMKREQLKDNEIGYLGVNLETAQEITESFSRQFRMPIGVYINDVVEDSPAEEAGLKAGHIITGLNRLKIETIEDLVNAISYCRAGETITLQISELQKGGYVEKELKVVLGKR